MFSEDKVLRKRQEIALDMFLEFRRVCDKFGLIYFAICGTCLGAVRHQGFIPWDDDIDVTMPYEDYCRFREIAPKELKEPYAVYDQHANRHAIHFFVKIHDESTAYIPNRFSGFYDRYVGFSMDIMPLYGCPNGASKQRISEKHCIKYLKYNRLQRMPFSFENSSKGKIAWILNAPNRIRYPFDYFGEKAEREFGSYDFGNSDMVMFGWRYDEGKIFFPREDFTDGIEVPFENETIRIPKGYDRYLRQEYGDYMRLPPEDQRIQKHVPAIIDFEKSYREYLPHK